MINLGQMNKQANHIISLGQMNNYATNNKHRTDE